MTAHLLWPPPGKHTRIARLTSAHLDELLRRKIAREKTAITRTTHPRQGGPPHGR